MEGGASYWSDFLIARGLSGRLKDHLQLSLTEVLEYTQSHIPAESQRTGAVNDLRQFIIAKKPQSIRAASNAAAYALGQEAEFTQLDLVPELRPVVEARALLLRVRPSTVARLASDLQTVNVRVPESAAPAIDRVANAVENLLLALPPEPRPEQVAISEAAADAGAIVPFRPVQLPSEVEPGALLSERFADGVMEPTGLVQRIQEARDSGRTQTIVVLMLLAIPTLYFSRLPQAQILGLLLALLFTAMYYNRPEVAEELQRLLFYVVG